MANLADQEPLEELGEELEFAPPPPAAPQILRSKFGDIELEGSDALEIVSAILRKCSEVIVYLDQRAEVTRSLPDIHAELAMRNQREVALENRELVRMLGGDLREVLSDVRAIQKEAKSLERQIRAKRR